MKLYFSATSPFVRKVLICAHEKGLAERIEFLDEDMVAGANPLAKVPALQTDDGDVIIDSLVICDYFETLTKRSPMIPTDLKQRNGVLQRHALADGIMEAAVASVMESRRPADKIWDGNLSAQRSKVTAALDVLQSQAQSFGDIVDLGTVSAGAALGYLDLRFAALDWRANREQLAKWYEKFSHRASMQATAPPT